MTLTMQGGGKNTTLEEVQGIPVPEATRTYQPVSHKQLAFMLLEMANQLLPEYAHEQSQYGLAAEGNKMFGVHTFRSEESAFGLAIGFRNSYDRSMSLGVVVGATVMVCSNLALSGDITVMRKHTPNVLRDLESMALSAIYGSQRVYREIMKHAEAMQTIPMDDDEAHRMLGLIYGRGIISLRQIPVAEREWQQPQHAAFQDRNAWSFYNAITESLKSSPPHSIMEKHLELHRLITQQFPMVEVQS